MAEGQSSSDSIFGGIGSGLLSGALNSAVGLFSQRSAIKKQLAWERERATHAHQWEVSDLRNAGLNPILSANGGATTGGLNVPQVNGAFDLSSGISSAAAAKQAATAERIGKETAHKLISDTFLNYQNARTLSAQESYYDSLKRQVNQNININRPQEGYSGSRMGMIMPYVNGVVQPLKDAVVGISSAVGVKKGFDFARAMSQGRFGKNMAGLDLRTGEIFR